MTDSAYDGPIFLVPLSLSYPSSPVLSKSLLYDIIPYSALLSGAGGQVLLLLLLLLSGCTGCWHARDTRDVRVTLPIHICLSSWKNQQRRKMFFFLTSHLQKWPSLIQWSILLWTPRRSEYFLIWTQLPDSLLSIREINEADSAKFNITRVRKCREYR